jgi:flagellar hook-basal body complex protein FliE
MTIDPTFAVSGAEWQIGAVEAPAEAGATGSGAGSGFGKMLSGLQATQTDAAQAAQDLATGQATDPTAVVMAVERAQLSMQLASQIRNKSVEAVQTIFSTQI